VLLPVAEVTEMSMLNPDPGAPAGPGTAQRWIIGVAVLLALGVAGCVVALVRLSAELVNARTEIAALRREVSTVRQDVGAAESRARAIADALSDQLAATRAEARQNADRARAAAHKQTETLVSQVAVKQEEQGKLLAGELGRLKDSADRASARLTDIGSEVGQVKTEVGDVKTQVASTRSELDKTIAEMRRVNGDLGVMSGLIATNAKEIAALRALGDRDYFEFTLGKAQSKRQLAGVSLVYKKADPKRNRYSLEVITDDKRVEKKDRTANEPVQFYVSSKARQPYEIVINEVRKDLLVGYLAAPKTQVAQR
jgi:chromosome segregation ATPase